MLMKFAAIKRTVDPAIEPVSLRAAKGQLRIEPSNADEDFFINSIIKAAREWVEEKTRMSLIQQTWKTSYAGWPDDRFFDLEMPPFVAIVDVNYFDVNEVEQAVGSSNYNGYYGNPAKVLLRSTYIRPSLSIEHQCPVSVTYTAGYGLLAATVPGLLQQAILLLIEHMYKYRGPAVEGAKVTTVPLSVESILSHFKTIRI